MKPIEDKEEKSEELENTSPEKETTMTEEKEISKEEEYLSGWKRCQADFENYRKRQGENQKDLIRYTDENWTLQILPIIDNFRASVEHVPEEQKKSPWVVGIMHIQKQLEKVLADNGIEEIEVKIGDDFNPQIHEAVHTEKDKEEKELKHKIAKIISSGYKIGEKVIRAAKVIVA